MTLLGMRLSLDAVDPRLIGGIMVSYSIGFVLGSLYSIHIVHRVGHIRAFAVLCAMLGIAALCYPMNDAFFLWLTLRVVGGFAMAGLLIVVESWFSATATNENRASIFSLYQICFYLATSLGQLLVMLGQPSNYFLFSLAAIVLMAAIIPLGLTRMQSPMLESVERLSLKKVFAISPLGVLATFVSGIVFSSFYGVGPLFANLIGLSIDQTAWFMSISVFTAMLFAWPIGWLCDRIDRVKILFYLTGLGTLLSVLICFTLNFSWLVMLLNALFIGLAAAIYPVGVALMNDRINSDQMISASATLLLSFGVGSCVGPLVSSLFIELFGSVGFHMGNIILLLSLCIYTQFRLGKGFTIDVEDQEPFVSLMPEASPVINELNPLNESFEEVPIEDIQPIDDFKPDPEIEPKEEPKAR